MQALISVSDKTGIVDFAKALSALQIKIISTGGTAVLLREHDIAVQEVADYTGYPEMMGGRVKTLHSKIHGGLLGRLEQDSMLMRQAGIEPIDLIVVNLYPFEQTIEKTGCTLEHAIENIDIGGPAMLRSAAKNYQRVTAIVDPADYSLIMTELIEGQGHTQLTTRFQLAQKVFAHTAAYDGTIANYLSVSGKHSPFPDTLTIQYRKKTDLRYGENNHQKAAFYITKTLSENSISTAEQLQGKTLSYNNIADADAAFECVKQFQTLPACVIVKHANPCGAAQAITQLSAYQHAFATDPTSAFGGIIAFNTPLECLTADAIINNQFVEVLIVPAIEPGVEEIIATKKNIRLLCTGSTQLESQPEYDYKKVTGGLLIQDKDNKILTADHLTTVTERQPTAEDIEDCLFAWKVCRFVKSNAIVYVKQQRTLGIGAGQMSRVMSVKIGTMKAEEAGLSLEKSVLASDAFFPFRDGVDLAARAGVQTIIQPGGSVNDVEVIAAANEFNIAMLFTGIRHFRH